MTKLIERLQNDEIAPFATKNRSKNDRYVIIVDRDGNHSKTVEKENAKVKESNDYMYFFHPPKQYGNINRHNIMTEILHLNTLECILPIINTKMNESSINEENYLKQKYIGGKNLCEGKMLCFSFHILSDDVIRCYLYVDQKYVRINLIEEYMKIILEEYIRNTNSNTIHTQTNGSKYDKFAIQTIDTTFDNHFRWVKNEILKCCQETSPRDGNHSTKYQQQQQIYSSNTMYGLHMLSNLINTTKTVQINKEQIRTKLDVEELRSQFIVQNPDYSFKSYSDNFRLSNSGKTIKESCTHYWSVPKHELVSLIQGTQNNISSKIFYSKEIATFYCRMSVIETEEKTKEAKMCLVFQQLPEHQNLIISCDVFCSQMDIFYAHHPQQSLTEQHSTISTYFQSEMLQKAYAGHNGSIQWEITISEFEEHMDSVLQNEYSSDLKQIVPISENKLTPEDEKIINNIMHSLNSDSTSIDNSGKIIFGDAQKSLLHQFTSDDIINTIKQWVFRDIKFKKGLMKSMETFSKCGLSGQNIMQLSVENIQRILEKDLLSIMTAQTFEIILDLIAKEKGILFGKEQSISAPKIGYLVYMHPLNLLFSKITEDHIDGQKFITYYEQKYNWIKNATGWSENDVYQIQSILFKYHAVAQSQISSIVQKTFLSDDSDIISDAIDQYDILSKFNVELCYKIDNAKQIEQFSMTVKNMVNNLHRIQNKDTNDVVRRMYQQIAD
eukprot:504073_1